MASNAGLNLRQVAADQNEDTQLGTEHADGG